MDSRLGWGMSLQLQCIVLLVLGPFIVHVFYWKITKDAASVLVERNIMIQEVYSYAWKSSVSKSHNHRSIE
jgi:hypothetical protein